MRGIGGTVPISRQVFRPFEVPFPDSWLMERRSGNGWLMSGLEARTHCLSTAPGHRWESVDFPSSCNHIHHHPLSINNHLFLLHPAVRLINPSLTHWVHYPYKPALHACGPWRHDAWQVCKAANHIATAVSGGSALRHWRGAGPSAGPPEAWPRSTCSGANGASFSTWGPKAVLGKSGGGICPVLWYYSLALHMSTILKL